MKLAIHEFLAGEDLSPERISRFIEDHAWPLVEQTHTTFLYRGRADQVRLRHWVYGLASAQSFTRVAETDLWYYILELPKGSRVEYKLEIERGGEVTWIRDPLNPLLAHDPFGANSVCAAWGYHRPDWTVADPEARPGHLEHHTLRNTPFGDSRPVTVYLPARFRPSRRYPLLVVHDGGDYLRYADLRIVLDNLIHRMQVSPLVAVLTHPRNRLEEYPHHEPHARFIVDHVLPFASAHYPLYDRPRSRALMGASFGAVASLSAAWRYPGVFGALLLQSGSFAFTDIGEHTRGPAFDRVVEFVNAFRDEPGRPADRVYLSCGMYESLIYENRSMMPLLQTNGIQVRYEEARDGHNWENWRDRLRSALSWLFPGPLWLVYE